MNRIDFILNKRKKKKAELIKEIESIEEINRKCVDCYEIEIGINSEEEKRTIRCREFNQDLIIDFRMTEWHFPDWKKSLGNLKCKEVKQFVGVKNHEI